MSPFHEQLRPRPDTIGLQIKREPLIPGCLDYKCCWQGHSSRSVSDYLCATIRPFPFSCLILAKVAPCGRCRVRIKLEDQVVWRLTIPVGAYNQRNMNYLPLGSLWQLLCKDRGCFRPSIGRLMSGPKKLGQLQMSKTILDHRLGFPRFHQKA